MLALIAARRFGPLFVTQFLGAFNDNLFKTAFIFAVTFRLRADDPAGAAALATVAAGVFIAPYILFSGLAGDLADRLDKALIAVWVKVAEIAFMGLGTLALALDSEALCLGVLALMGLHSTIFGPVKYAILPQHLAERELLLGTGLVEGATFVAILLGQIAGGLLPTGLAGPVAIGIAVAGLLSARFIPPAPPAGERGRIDWNPLTSTRTALGHAFSSRPLSIATLAISWFWALGAIYTSQFVPLARNYLGGNEALATFFLAAFSVGIAVGSAGVARLLRGRISARLAAPAVLVMALAALDLYFAESAFSGAPAGSISGLLSRPAGWRLMFDLLAMALAGGVFSVPLYGILQTATRPQARARTIAANNIVNAIFQVGGVLIIGSVLGGGAPVPLALAAAGLTGLLLIPLLRQLP
ncbi:Na+/melibiose symporter-like transporter [Polymorphobacter multimanifer]|uniref:Na+/melibiose symporter-like transporter n=1 Tax=Polymorphobacter multimanifer TaxID=1070431 RepID=A0A841LDL3_9SPHN|nr:MFS transporter [Polymorphobacter multimanifer]MBB6227068.1 Na+/melibiose symporter-like transporter [Polymorphobacter multimanifer]